MGYGPPKVKCSTCGGINGTGMKWARDSSKSEKEVLWIRRCLRSAIWFILLGKSLVSRGSRPIGSSWSGGGSISFGLLLIGIGVVLVFRNRKKLFESERNEKEYLKLYDAEGYLPSHIFTAKFGGRK